MSSVLSIGPRIPVAVTIALAVSLHAGAAAGATAAALFSQIFHWNQEIRGSISARLDALYEVDMVKQEVTPPPPEPEEPTPVVKEVVKEVPKDEPTPPPLPAAAAAVLTAEPTPNAPPDMVDFTTGAAKEFAGGQTSTVGDPNSGPVRNVAAANNGVPGGTGNAPTAVVPKKEDKSRAAALSGSANWNDCPFPGEADAEQIDSEYVTLQVRVKADGTPEGVTIIQDPGHGFGREARKCAMRKRYTPALDVDGVAVAGATSKFRVHFTR